MFVWFLKVFRIVWFFFFFFFFVFFFQVFSYIYFSEMFFVFLLLFILICFCDFLECFFGCFFFVLFMFRCLSVQGLTEWFKGFCFCTKMVFDENGLDENDSNDRGLDKNGF